MGEWMGDNLMLIITKKPESTSKARVPGIVRRVRHSPIRKLQMWDISRTILQLSNDVEHPICGRGKDSSSPSFSWLFLALALPQLFPRNLRMHPVRDL